jgi:hypothetical protein
MKSLPALTVTLVSIALAGAAAGCGGSGAGGHALRDGVYQFRLTEAYLRQNGVPAQLARGESGVHEFTLDRGSFVDRWRSPDGTVGACWGAYVIDGNRVTFRWTGGCTGDWAMSYRLDRDVVTWSDFQPLQPGAGPEDEKVAEVFNGVTWTRLGGVSEKGDQQ